MLLEKMLKDCIKYERGASCSKGYHFETIIWVKAYVQKSFINITLDPKLMKPEANEDGMQIITTWYTDL